MADAHPVGEFDPLDLTAEASLNRTCLAALPGADARWVGRRAFELLSLQALEQLAGEMGWPTHAARRDVSWSLAAALAGPDQPLAVHAAGVVEAFGRRLAHLLATLTTPAADVAGESPWRAAYLRHWTQIHRVWLGGGLADALGSHLVSAARREVERLAPGARTIMLAPHPSVAALIGAARSTLHPQTHTVVLDFGHTTVKRGVAIVRARSLQRLQLLPGCAVHPLHNTTAADGAVEFVLETVAETWRMALEQVGELDSDVVVSLASYVSAGRPVDSRSLYAPLGVVGQAVLDDAISERTGTATSLRFLHDGTAAGRGVPDAGRAAVILLGTSLGVGFPPPPRTLLPISDHFFVGPAMGG